MGGAFTVVFIHGRERSNEERKSLLWMEEHECFGWRESIREMVDHRIVSLKPRMVNGQKRGHDDDEIITDERMFQNIMRLTGSGGVMEKGE